MEEKYVTHKEFLSAIKDIKENHLASIIKQIESVARDVRNLRWFFLGGIGLLGVVLTMLQVFD